MGICFSGTLEGTRLHLRIAQIADRLRQAVGGNSPLDCCILMFESLGNRKQKSRHPEGYLLFWYAGRDSNPRPTDS